MSFTNRFIKVPIEIVNKEVAELTDNAEQDAVQTYAMVNPLDISFYHPVRDEEGNLTRVTVFMKSGQDISIDMSIKEFENLLNNFDKR